MKPQYNRNRGFALVAVLLVLILVVVLVVAFTFTMRTERVVASNMVNSQKTELMVQSAMAHAVSLLANNIPDPVDPTLDNSAGPSRNWYTNPGQLTVINGGAPPERIPLYTGVAAAADPAKAVNLNALTTTSFKYPITGAPDPMWISWTNVLRDPSAPADVDNKIVGRYAFWIDDESTKINVNTARGKPASMASSLKLPSNWGASPPRDLLPYMGVSFPVGSTNITRAISHPASVNLDSLGVNISQLQEDVDDYGFLPSTDAIQGYFLDPTKYEQEKFNLTAYSRSPEFNVFGKSRIFFTKWATSTEMGPAYQHTYHPNQPTTFYSTTMGVTTSEGNDAPLLPVRKVQEPVIESLAKYLERSDWPGTIGNNFRWTSAPDQGPEESDQIAVNINSMVSVSLRGSPGGQGDNSTGSNVCDDLDRKWGVAGDYVTPFGNERSNVWKGPLSGKGMFGLHPFPQLNEMGIRIVPLAVPASVTGYANKFRMQVDIVQEVYLPPGYFRNTGSGTGMWTAPSSTSGYQMSSYAPYVEVSITGPVNRTNTAYDGGTIAFKGRTIASTGPMTDGYMALSLGRVVAKTNAQFTTSGGSPQDFPRSGIYTITAKVRSGLGANAANFASQIAPFPIPAGQAPGETVPPGLAATPDSEGYLEFTTTLDGAAVQSYIDDPTEAPTVTFELDDPRTYYTKAAWKAAETHTLGAPNSASTADDSKISNFAMTNLRGSGNAEAIGMLSFIPTGTQRGISWDTLRFYQYTPYPGDLPDWMVLDLVAPYYGYPISQRNSTAGKINLNSRIFPDNSDVFTPPARIKPLKALFENMPNGANAAEAIANWQTSGRGFDYIGRICEVDGVADESHGTLEFDKEVILRNLAGVMTTQSNTFGVWGAAQTLKKRPGNTLYGEFEPGDIVTGERRFYAVVERFVWPGNDGIPGNGAVNGSGEYTSLAFSDSAAKSPAMPPAKGLDSNDPNNTQKSRIKTSDPTYQWPAIDGPQQPQLDPVHGTANYSHSSAENANNPLAALMKYRIIHFSYVE